MFRKVFLPAPIAAAYTVWRSIAFVWKGVRCLLHRKLEVEVLDALSITASVSYTHLDLPQVLPVDEMDLCLVLSNLLENAFEASLRTAPARRKIEITAYVHAERLLLVEVENAFDGAVHEKSGVFRSSKRRENGIGIQSVRHIAEKTGGASTFTYQNDIFSAKVMLCG